MIALYFITFLSLLLSLLRDKKKTLQALKIGLKKLGKITPPFLLILIMISICLYLIPQDMIIYYLGKQNQAIGISIALIVGSVTVIPGPIVYPLCKILLTQGVSYSVIAAFSTSLMMVGILTFPMEKKYFGTKFALTRNFISLIIAIIISTSMILFQGFLE